nr:vacuolar protein sorting-associated protein 52 A isoform X1 [Ipomoea batatas]
MSEVATSDAGEGNDGQRSFLDLGSYVADLNVEDDATSEGISLEGLEVELEECKSDDVVANILSKGMKLREYTKGVENNLRQVELDSIQVCYISCALLPLTLFFFFCWGFQVALCLSC